MIKPFRLVIIELEDTFRRLEGRVPPPTKVPFEDGFKLRYQEKTVHQALIQKFARLISGLYALNLLMENGFCQEQGVIQRTLEEIEEDICFLALGTSVKWTERHDKYLEYFWEEGPEVGMVRRDKIRAFVHNTCGLDDPSSGNSAARSIFKTYSGYVHANSIAIVDMCAGDPPVYHLAGMTDNPLYQDHVEDAWNHFYRGLASALWMAKAFEDGELWQDRYQSLKRFEAAFGEKIFPVSGAGQ